MQEDILTAPPEFKLYKDNAVWVGTFIGGPTYSSWRTVWIALVGATILFAVIFGLLFLLDKDFLQSP